MTEQMLTGPQRDAMTAGEWFRSRYGNKALTTSGGSGRYSSINLRTMRKLAEFGYVIVHETYSRQDGGNVWTATMTPKGEAVRFDFEREHST